MSVYWYFHKRKALRDKEQEVISKAGDEVIKKMDIKNIISKNKKHSSKLIASALTIFILGLLVLSGPAQAFELGLSVDLGENHNFTSGDNVELTANFDINNNDANLPIENLSLFIDGPGANDYTCYFNLDGSKISGCDGITIELINTNVNYGYGYSYGYNNNNYYDFGYGYGYGYGYGNNFGTLTYKITIDTDDYHLGSYTAIFSAEIGNNNNPFESDSSHFIISERPANSGNQYNTNGGCLTKWKCTDWSSCINGEQIRTCNKEKIYCYANPKDKPIEQQTCSITGNNENTNGNGNGNSNTETQTLTTNSEDNNQTTNQGRLSGITGAVTGTLGNTGWLIIIAFIIGIIGLSVAVSIIRKRRLRFRY